MTAHRPLGLRLLAPALVLLLLAALAASGCGGSSKAAGSGGADPATAAPVGSALFVDVDVRPTGTEKANVERLGRAILDTADFGAELRRLLAKQSGGKTDLDFAKDVEPWLGDRLGVALPSFAERADPLLIAATTDDDLARESLKRGIPSAAEATYRDVTYQHSPDGARAAAVVDHLALYGSERDVKQGIDAAKGTSLGETEPYRNATSRLPADPLATGYLDLKSAISTASTAAGQSGTAGIFSSVLGKDVAGVGLGAYADADAIRLEVAVPGAGSLAGGALGGGAADALASAPAGAWLGIGLGDVGKTLNGLLDALASGGGLGAVGVQAILGQAQQALGLDIRRDLLAWMGSSTIFVSGTTRATVGGALVVHSTDPAATRRAIAKLRAALPRLTNGASVTAVSSDGATGFSFPIGKTTRATIAAKGDTFVIAIGAGALREALRSGERLGDSAKFKAVAAKLDGSEPVLYLDLQQVADLVGAFGGAKAKDTVDILQRFTQLAAGGRSDGDTGRATVVAGVKVQ